jgi:hypothetical protein
MTTAEPLTESEQQALERVHSGNPVCSHVI